MAKEYSRLPGAGLRRDAGTFFVLTRSSCRLWLGSDHLLQVESQGGYLESYKRFYLRDIQSLILRKTKNGAVINGILAAIAGLLLLWSLMVNDTAGRITLTFIASSLGVLLLGNSLFGPTCTCHMKTAVHLEELPSLRRLRRARKVIARLRPLIEQAQGTMAREELTTQFDAALARFGAEAATTVGRTLITAATALKPYSSRAHQILFFVLLADALLSALNIFAHSAPIILLSMLTGVGFFGAVVFALVKQHETDLDRAVRRLTWVSACYAGAGYVVGYILMAVLIPNAQLHGTQWEYVEALAKLDPMVTTSWLVMLVINVVVSGSLGTAGLTLLARYWRQKSGVTAAPPVLAPPPETPPQP